MLMEPKLTGATSPNLAQFKSEYAEKGGEITSEIDKKILEINARIQELQPKSKLSWWDKWIKQKQESPTEQGNKKLVKELKGRIKFLMKQKQIVTSLQKDLSKAKNINQIQKIVAQILNISTQLQQTLKQQDQVSQEVIGSRSSTLPPVSFISPETLVLSPPVLDEVKPIASQEIDIVITQKEITHQKEITQKEITQKELGSKDNERAEELEISAQELLEIAINRPLDFAHQRLSRTIKTIQSEIDKCTDADKENGMRFKAEIGSLLLEIEKLQAQVKPTMLQHPKKCLEIITELEKELEKIMTIALIMCGSEESQTSRIEVAKKMIEELPEVLKEKLTNEQNFLNVFQVRAEKTNRFMMRPTLEEATMLAEKLESITKIVNDITFKQWRILDKSLEEDFRTEIIEAQDILGSRVKDLYLVLIDDRHKMIRNVSDKGFDLIKKQVNEEIEEIRYWVQVLRPIKIRGPILKLMELKLKKGEKRGFVSKEYFERETAGQLMSFLKERTGDPTRFESMLEQLSWDYKGLALITCWHEVECRYKLKQNSLKAEENSEQFKQFKKRKAELEIVLNKNLDQASTEDGLGQAWKDYITAVELLITETEPEI